MNVVVFCIIGQHMHFNFLHGPEPISGFFDGLISVDTNLSLRFLGLLYAKVNLSLLKKCAKIDIYLVIMFLIFGRIGL